MEGVLSRPPNYQQGRKCASFKLMHRLVANCSMVKLNALEQEMIENPCEGDMLMYENIFVDYGEHPIYWLFEVIEVSRRSLMD